MLRLLLRFEIGYHFSRISFKVACLLFLVLGILAVSKGGFGGEDVHKNSPFVSTYIISFLSLFSIFSATLFCADVVLRDTLYKMDSIIYATSMTRVSYFTVRFVGLLMAVFAHLCFAVLGLFIGTMFVKNANLGEVNISFYLYPLVIFGLPNVLLSVSKK